MKTLKTSFLIVIFFLGLANFCYAQADGEPSDFSAKDISGRSIKLSDFKGKVVLLDFWATWCPPCRVEVPNLLDIFRKFKDRDFILISVSLDRDLQAARQFVKDKEMDWLHIIDREAGRAIADLYQVEYIPATFLINRKGKIESSQLRGDELKNKIAALLK
ncbi:MAG: TlpA disulfide reductase family protein [Candidatus Aminicenantes bacterium]|nr:TlpA disulfide reductase family protein [Candidatus Aminicenantes bacterium]